MVAQQLVSGCQAPVQGRATAQLTQSRSASALAHFAGKRIAAFGGSKQSIAFTGVSLAAVLNSIGRFAWIN